MSDLSPRGERRVTRAERVDRAYQLVVAGGVAGLAFVAMTVLAILNIVGWTLPVLTLIVAVLCFVLFQRTVAPQKKR